MRTTQVHISQSTGDRKLYVSAQVEVPGLGTVDMKDVVSQKTIDLLFAEVAAAAELKLKGHVIPFVGECDHTNGGGRRP